MEDLYVTLLRKSTTQKEYLLAQMVSQNWFSAAAFSFILPCRLKADRQTEAEVSILSYASSSEHYSVATCLTAVRPIELQVQQQHSLANDPFMLGSCVKDTTGLDLPMVCKVFSQETNTYCTLKLNVFYAENQPEMINIDIHDVIFRCSKNS